MSKLPDPFLQGLRAGWHVHDARTYRGTTVACDVVVIGTGAGGGITAELLTQAGFSVVMVEEGPLKTSSDFNQKESEAYADLYQESAARQTVDRTISILQGRCVGGSTVVNWTTSFRTPASTLNHWRQHFGLSDYTPEAMQAHFEQVEQRLHVAPWEAELNTNNQLLAKGMQNLGMHAGRISRNVKGCWNLGSCGMGCPTNAKQSMLVTTIPGALQGGAKLFHHLRAEHFEWANDQVSALVCQAVAPNAHALDQAPIRILARHYVLAAGGINSPAMLMRSDAPDASGLLGKRTFLHPVAFCSAVFDQPVEAWAGAPQTVYTDAFMDHGAQESKMGFKIEPIPLHPGLTSILLGHVGPQLAARMAHYPRTHMLHALLRDGFHADSAGGRVFLNLDRSPALYYPLNDYLMDGMRRAFLALARIQFAAGAKQVLPMHDQARYYTSVAEAEAEIAKLDMSPYITGIGSAHVMGGCGMAADPAKGVTDPNGRYWGIRNLSIHDGSLFPTSIGANPQLSVYGLAHRHTLHLIQQLKSDR